MNYLDASNNFNPQQFIMFDVETLYMIQTKSCIYTINILLKIRPAIEKCNFVATHLLHLTNEKFTS